MTFEEFEAVAAQYGLKARKALNHWELRGKAPLFVEFYPDKNLVRRNENYARPVAGTVDDALKVAIEMRERPASVRHSPQPTRVEQLERIVKLATDYIGSDETRICDLSGERLLAALQLMRSLAENGFVEFEREMPF